MADQAPSHQLSIDRLREAMEDKAITQARFAHEGGLSRPYVSRVLSGERQPNFLFIAAIMKLFPQYSLGYFFTPTVNMSCQQCDTCEVSE